MNTKSIFVPVRFERAVQVHLAKGYIRAPGFDPPTFLGIHGPSGEGKTYQCRVVVQRLGGKVIEISAGELEHPDAGTPARILQRKYAEARTAIEQDENTTAVLLMDDIDTGLGNWGDLTQYTSNRQHVIGEVLKLAEQKLEDGSPSPRVILTGNDFGKLYYPLVRSGRMKIFEWIPTASERTELVRTVFPHLDVDECRALVKKLTKVSADIEGLPSKQLPFAFFTHLKAEASDAVVEEFIASQGARAALQRLKAGHHIPLHDKPSLEELFRLGQDIISTQRLRNHIEVTR